MADPDTDTSDSSQECQSNVKSVKIELATTASFLNNLQRNITIAQSTGLLLMCCQALSYILSPKTIELTTFALRWYRTYNHQSITKYSAHWLFEPGSLWLLTAATPAMTPVPLPLNHSIALPVALMKKMSIQWQMHPDGIPQKNCKIKAAFS